MSTMAAIAFDETAPREADDPHGNAEDSANYPDPSDPEHGVFVLDGIDDDLLADFAAVGITIRGVKDDTAQGDGVLHQEAIVHDAAHRAALAATFLRRAAECDAEIAQLKATMLLQVALVTEHYGRLMATADERRAFFTRMVENVAREAAAAGDFGKKKSAAAPFGEFGVQDRKAGVHLSDAAALLAYAKAHAPEFVRVTAKIPLAQAREYLSPTELEATKMEAAWGDLKKTLSADGALPPGVERVEAARVPFAKPELPLAMGLQSVQGAQGGAR